MGGCHVEQWIKCTYSAAAVCDEIKFYYGESAEALIQWLHDEDINRINGLPEGPWALCLDQKSSPQHTILISEFTASFNY